MKRTGWLLGRGMQFTGASLILLDLITWLDGDLVGTNSFWIGAGLLSAGSFIAPKKESFTSESIDISEIDFKVVYKEHDGKLWRYTALPGDLSDEVRDAAISATVSKYSFRQVEIRMGTPEWRDYYEGRMTLRSEQEERRRRRKKPTGKDMTS